MSRRSYLLAVLPVVALLSTPGLARAAEAQAEARFALVVGRNDGGADKPKLRFAEAEAARFARTLIELGGFPEANVKVLTGAQLTEVLGALEILDGKIREARAGGGRSALLVVYWSGHAEDEGLELGSERLPFATLRDRLDRSPADTRIAFVDACRSGSMTLKKGARATTEEFEIVVAAEPTPEGTAIVTSTAPGEDALESAELRGSFFTHHLMAGLRGTADESGDGRVTLQEAYRYAYLRTVTHSAQAAGVPQHPTYALDLHGKGEVVLTDLHRAEASLVFPPAAPRRWLVVNTARSSVYEVRTTPERGQSLALAAGTYRVVRIDDDDLRSAELELSPGDSIVATELTLDRTPYALVARKGAGARERLSLSVIAGLASAPLEGAGPLLSLGIGTHHALGRRLGLRPSLRWAGRGVDDAGLPYRLDRFGGRLDLGWQGRISALELSAGPALGLTYSRQRLGSGEVYGGLEVSGGAEAGLSLPLGRGFRLRAGLELMAHGFTLNEVLALRFSVGGTLAVRFGLLR